MVRTSNFDAISIEFFQNQLKKASIFIIILFAILILRLWFLQIVNGSYYRLKSEGNRIHLQDISPFRGQIFDCRGQILVGNRPSYDLYVIPEELQHPENLLQKLEQYANLDPKQVKKKLFEGSRIYPFKPVCLKSDISRNELAMIDTHRFNLPGVLVKTKPQRHYVYGAFASHLLGYLGEINENQINSGLFPYNKQGDLIGKSGVEKKWQSLLNGIPGGEQLEVDAVGRQIKVIARKESVPGANVFLTIDKDVQFIAEKALNGRRGAVMAIDPCDGSVLALASSPCFDPNQFIGGIKKTSWDKIVSSPDYPLQNRVLASQYPPGSIFKMIVALAGLQEGIIDPEEEVTCTGSFSLGRRTYGCWKKTGHGEVNLHRALVESCDVYFYKLGRKLGVDKIAQYAEKFGLGKNIGFDLGHEAKGLIPTRAWKYRKTGVSWQAGETLSVAIGQSYVLMTPLQAAIMISALFNGGNIYKPQVTKCIKKPSGEVLYRITPKLIGNIGIEEKYMALVKQALIDVVNKPKGTGRSAYLENIRVAGKTGTAQVVGIDKDKKGSAKRELPLHLRDHAWFVAIAPAEKPRIAIAVIIENGGHGGSAAAPVARDMIRTYMNGMGNIKGSKQGKND